MQIEFKVHGVANSKAGKTVEIGGQSIRAEVPCLEVELIDADNGAYTFRAIGDGVAAAKELFVQDAVIVATFAREE